MREDIGHIRCLDILHMCHLGYLLLRSCDQQKLTYSPTISPGGQLVDQHNFRKSMVCFFFHCNMAGLNIDGKFVPLRDLPLCPSAATKKYGFQKPPPGPIDRWFSTNARSPTV